MPILRGTAKDFEPLLAKKRETSVPNVAENTERHKSRAPRSRKPKEFLPENAVESGVVDYLRATGWHVTKQHVGLFNRKGSNQPFRVGVNGDPDWLCIRPLYPFDSPCRPACEVMYVETKAPGKKPSPNQKARIAELDRLGFVVIVADSFRSFETKYMAIFGARRPA